jgi:2-hydroxychromene-2-carboxylate isomerase
VRTPDDATLYFDLGSPYAYLVLERAEVVLGRAPALEPVLLGAIFRWRGRGSWAHTDQRAPGITEVERRARRYGLPPLVWPELWPTDGLAAMRAATWAAQQGRAGPFARAVFRRQFAQGADIADPGVLTECAADAGLDGAAMQAATRDSEVKDQLRLATERAWEAGVRGVPSLLVGGEMFYGDDQLEPAAARLGGAPA